MFISIKDLAKILQKGNKSNNGYVFDNKKRNKNIIRRKYYE